MPIPKAGEGEDKFVGRCIGYVMSNEGVTDSSHAAAKCHGIYRQWQKERKKEEEEIMGTEAKTEQGTLSEKTEYRARQTDPGKYESFRRENDAGGSGVDFVYGIYNRGGSRVSEIQSIVFDPDKFTQAEAKRWLKDHDKRTGIEVSGSKKGFFTSEGPGAGPENPSRIAGHYDGFPEVELPDHMRARDKRTEGKDKDKDIFLEQP